MEKKRTSGRPDALNWLEELQRQFEAAEQDAPVAQGNRDDGIRDLGCHR